MQPYTETFFAGLRETARQSSAVIVPLVLDLVRPRSVIDVGCGEGIWLSNFRRRGVEDVMGVDGGWVDKAQLAIPADRFLTHDLRGPIPVGRRFDLVVCLEVAEHLPEDCATTFVESLTRLGPVVLFSAAIPFQGGTDHVNEQWPEYWASHFSERQFVAVDCLRARVWREPTVAWYYAQNMLLFVARDYLTGHDALRREADRTNAGPPALVHPQLYLATAERHAELSRRVHDLEAVTRFITCVVPHNETLVLVDGGCYGGTVAAGRRAYPFLERNGDYWGPPQDDATAVRECERLRKAGANFMVFAWPAFWWLDHYTGLRDHLRANYPCVLENDRLIIFDLRPGLANPGRP
jgi:SAM-dependent methyltransferase